MRISISIFGSLVLLFSITCRDVWGMDVESLCSIPDNYSLSRPEPDQGPTRVTINLFLLNITRVDDIEQTFTADFYIKTTWKDARLARDQSGRLRCAYPLEKIWYPQIIITNGASIKPKYKDWGHVAVDGTVTHSQRFYGNITNDFELQKYPFDHQVLIISVGSFLSQSEVLIELGKFTGRNPDISISNWNIVSSKNHVKEKFVTLDQKKPFAILLRALR